MPRQHENLIEKKMKLKFVQKIINVMVPLNIYVPTYLLKITDQDISKSSKSRPF